MSYEINVMEWIDPDAAAGCTKRLIEHLSTYPLYRDCREPIWDACRIVDLCCPRLPTPESDSTLKDVCVNAVRYEEAIFQYASTDPPARTALWIRHFTECRSATDEQAFFTYALGCSIKALGELTHWMCSSIEDAIAADWQILELSWEDFCRGVESSVTTLSRIQALELYAHRLDSINHLPALKNSEFAPVALEAIKAANRIKGGVLSGEDRNDENAQRDAALVARGEALKTAGMPERSVSSAVHRWLQAQIEIPPQQRPAWLTPETDKAITRKSVESVLRREGVVSTRISKWK